MKAHVSTKRVGKIRDPYHSKRRFEKWDKTLPDAAPADNSIILEYIADMQEGYNVGGGKGARSYIRLCTIRSRMSTLSRLITAHAHKTLTTVTDRELHKLFNDMREGRITKTNGEQYLAVADYVKTFKSFYHWLQRRERKNGRDLQDITIDLDTSRVKPKFNYLTFEKAKTLADAAKYQYRVLIWFLFDSGMRPSEMLNIRVCDLERGKDGIYTCDIREETSKTFGRKIKLLLCSDMLKEYLFRYELKGEAFIWDVSHSKTAQYLKRLGARALNLPDFCMYDLRHSSACYWLPRYRSHSALMYRFGWIKPDMIHYYTEFLGMKDTITKDDLIDSEERQQQDAEIKRLTQEQAIAKEQMEQLNDMMRRMQAAIVSGKVDKLVSRALQRRKDAPRDVSA